jgi:hypothetical protein
MLLLTLLSISSFITIAAAGEQSFLWWVRPGVYFVYRYTSQATLYIDTKNFSYATNTIVVNYTIVNVRGDSLVVNLSITLVNTDVCRDDVCENIVERGVNKTFSTIIELDNRFGAYINGSWVTDWIFIATLNQLKGEEPKICEAMLNMSSGTAYDPEDPNFNKSITIFLNTLRAEIGEEMLRYITNSTHVFGSEDRIMALTSSGKPARTLFFYSRSVYYMYVISPPPTSFSITIKNHTLSGDRIAVVKPITHVIDFLVNVSRVTESEKVINASAGKVYVLRFRNLPLKLYALELPGPIYLFLLLYNLDRKTISILSPSASLLSAYYDYVTGVLLYADIDIRLLLSTYMNALGIRSVGSPAALSQTGFMGKLILVDTNIDFERPVIGGAEAGVNLVYIALGGAIALTATALIIALLRVRRVRS